ncbi:hypothetical protein ACIA6C_28045 [Streptomyces sp. NPDC051578]|uniref:hypothetical protein n=1 Tax=Streptomyces sp. NPDC051578 TaxID=3365662 RepID=UPI0037B40D45
MTAESTPRLRSRDRRTANRSRHFAQKRTTAEQAGPRAVADAAFDQVRGLILDLPAADQDRAYADLTAALDDWRLRHVR